MLAGDNSDRPHLVFASEPKAIRIGDRVVTSGEGGVFPPGLPVGVVAAIDPGGAHVEPYAELSQLDYVLLVDYGLAGGLPLSAPAGSGQKRRQSRCSADDEEDALSGGAQPLQLSDRAAGEQGPRAVSADRDGRCRGRLRAAAASRSRICRADPGLRADGGVSLVGLPARPAAAERSVRDRLRAGSADRRAALPASALALLLARAAVLRYRRHFVGRPFPFVWAGFAPLAAAVMVGLWALHCVLQLNLFDLRTAIIRGALTVALFPAASLVLGRSQRALIGASA